jgi:hypothetical protein
LFSSFLGFSENTRQVMNIEQAPLHTDTAGNASDTFDSIWAVARAASDTFTS